MLTLPRHPFPKLLSHTYNSHWFFSSYLGSSVQETQHPQNRLFDKVLIANRGEICLRIARTCRRLGIPTVAVYSTMDAGTPFVQAADEAVCIGPAPVTDSYLNTEAILEVIRQTGAQAVHPGYGFLSENASFCRAVEESGAVFLGPSVASIEKLGDKLQSKLLAVQAGVNIIPGYDSGPVESIEQTLQLCNEGVVPYPVLLKAAAGGGGKGMRVCHSDDDIREAWTVAKAEAIKFFKDDRLLLEKFIERPHHIEFQVLAAQNGSNTEVVVFPERECSIQRRNQKIIEESPSVLLNDATRLIMAEQVRRLCQTVGYRSAGTVEFLVDENQQFYFLEMNTRLQVEHPITEAITGTDLVEAMLHVGAGMGLPSCLQPYSLPGTIVPHAGHALEARIYAEDPIRNYLPSTGSLTKYVEPTTNAISPNDGIFPRNPPYVRLDSGVVQGQNISPYYDPMLSKLIYYGKDRPAAIAGLKCALDEYVIEGVQHNARLVQSILREQAFREGNTPTSFLESHYPDGFNGVVLSEQEKEEFSIAAAVISLERQKLMQHPPLAGGTVTDDTLIVRVGGQFGLAHRCYQNRMGTFTVQSLDENGESASECRTIHLDNELLYEPAKFLATLSMDDKIRTIQVLHEAVTGEIKMQMYGADADILVQSPREYELSRLYMRKPIETDTTNMVQTPMPGLLISYAVQPGQLVEVGQELCIIESMKMQNMIRSTRRGRIKACLCSIGASLKNNEVILLFGTDDDSQAIE